MRWDVGARHVTLLAVRHTGARTRVRLGPCWCEGRACARNQHSTPPAALARPVVSSLGPHVRDRGASALAGRKRAFVQDGSGGGRSRGLMAYAWRRWPPGRGGWRGAPTPMGVDLRCVAHALWWRDGGSVWRIYGIDATGRGGDPSIRNGLPGDFNHALDELPESVGLARLGRSPPNAGVATSQAVHPKRIGWVVLSQVAQYTKAHTRMAWGTWLPVHAHRWVGWEPEAATTAWPVWVDLCGAVVRGWAPRRFIFH